MERVNTAEGARRIQNFIPQGALAFAPAQICKIKSLLQLECDKTLLREQ